jgi:hypothetical protein
LILLLFSLVYVMRTWVGLLALCNKLLYFYIYKRVINARCGVVGASWSQLALVCLTIDFDKVLEKDKL